MRQCQRCGLGVAILGNYLELGNVTNDEGAALQANTLLWQCNVATIGPASGSRYMA